MQENLLYLSENSQIFCPHSNLLQLTCTVFFSLYLTQPKNRSLVKTVWISRTDACMHQKLATAVKSTLSDLDRQNRIRRRLLKIRAYRRMATRRTSFLQLESNQIILYTYYSGLDPP